MSTLEESINWIFEAQVGEKKMERDTGTIFFFPAN